MKKPLTLLIGLVVVVLLLGFMVFYQVRYDQVAVVTTFGAVGQGAVKTKPGLGLAWPPPIQQVHKYTTRLQLLEDESEELQTQDKYAVITRTYLAWRIADAAKFYVNLRDESTAQQRLRTLVRGLKAIVSQYRFDEMVNTDPRKLKLEAIEQAALADIRQQLQQQAYGVEAVQFGIRRLVLPEQTTEGVFQRERQTRETLAQNIRSSGQSQAAGIKAEAESTRQIILAFAEARAQDIRTRGRIEAAAYYRAFAANEDLAIYLRRIDTLKKVLPHNSTIVLDAEQIGLRDLMDQARKAPAPGGP